MTDWPRGLLSVVLLSLLLLACRSENAAGTGQAAAFEQGNAAFGAGRYSEAASLFEKVLQASPGSAEAWYNLGNAEYRAHHTAAAVLAYQKALLRSPHLKGAAGNLALAQERLPAPFSVREPAWKGAVSSPGASNTWALMAAVFFVALMAVVAFRPAGAAFARLALVLPLGLFWMVSLGCSWYSLQGEKKLRAVVLRPATLRGEGGQDLAELPEGLTLHLPDGTATGRTAVELPDGRRGFLADTDLGLIR